MSVINKMLRDLDNRQSQAATPVPPRPQPAGMAHGTVVVNPLEPLRQPRSRPRFTLPMLVTVLLGAGVAGACWYLPLRTTPAPVVAVSTSVAPAVAPASVSAPVVLASPVQAAVTAKPAPVPAAVPPSVLPQNTVSLKLATGLKDMPSAPLTPAVPQVPPQAPHRVPALEALAQAQSLWSAGSRAAALDLLRESLAVLERVNPAGAPASNTSVLAALARELARMEMAEGRVSQALSMLTRLEPALSGVADVWAIRGNAAQRLGRHDESVAAYQTALKLKPNEPRWMLGAAVSLAALGQTAPAAELAEKARAGGALSPEVATYLKQLGVSLPEH